MRIENSENPDGSDELESDAIRCSNPLDTSTSPENGANPALAALGYWIDKIGSALSKNPPARTEMVEAAERERLFDWEGAERLYQIRLAKALAENNSLEEYSVRSRLSQLYIYIDDLVHALRESILATRAVAGSKNNGVFVSALCSEARLHLRNQDLNQATIAVEAAIACVESPEFSAVGTVTGLPRAMVLTTRSLCEIEAKQLENAEANLKEAWSYLAPLQEATGLGGVQGQLCFWWSSCALLQRTAGDLSKCANAVEGAVSHARNVCLLPYCDSPFTRKKLLSLLVELTDLYRLVGREDEIEPFLPEIDVLRESLR